MALFMVFNVLFFTAATTKRIQLKDYDLGGKVLGRNGTNVFVSMLVVFMYRKSTVLNIYFCENM